jgi:hypothetical protein
MSEPTYTRSPPPPRAAWQEALDSKLLRRLLGRRDRPGLVPMWLARRIVAGIEAMGGNLPLLGYLARRHGIHEGFQKGMVPVVHAVWATPEAEEASTAPAQESRPGEAPPRPERPSPSQPLPRVQAKSSRLPVESSARVEGASALVPRPPASTPLVQQRAPAPPPAPEAPRAQAAPPPASSPARTESARPTPDPRDRSEPRQPAARAPAPSATAPRPVVRPMVSGSAPRGTGTAVLQGAPLPTVQISREQRASPAPTVHASSPQPRTPATGATATSPAAPGTQSALPLTREARPTAVRSEPPRQPLRVSPSTTASGGAGWMGTGTPLVYAGGAAGGPPVGPGHSFPGASTPTSMPVRRAASPGISPAPIVPGVSLPSAPPPPIMQPRPIAGTPGMDSRQEPTAGSTPRREIDIDELVDKVQRKLMRQLADERIRRGQPR